MVYLESFEEFQATSLELFARNPTKTRYSCKYKKNAKGLNEVVLKVTDDTLCVKFRTHEKGDLKYVDQFSQLFVIWTSVHFIQGESSLPTDVITAQKDPELGYIWGNKSSEKKNKTQAKKIRRKKD